VAGYALFRPVQDLTSRASNLEQGLSNGKELALADGAKAGKVFAQKITNFFFETPVRKALSMKPSSRSSGRTSAPPRMGAHPRTRARMPAKLAYMQTHARIPSVLWIGTLRTDIGPIRRPLQMWQRRGRSRCRCGKG
jgi:hypothetical protein